MLDDRSKQRRRILFFAEAVTLAHMARLAMLASRLPGDGFDVIFACHPRYNHLFPELGARQVDLFSIPSSQFTAALAKGTPVYSTDELVRYVEDDLKVIDEHRPDVVVGDFRLSLSISARLRHVPYVNVTNAHWSPFAIQSYPIPEHPLVGLLGVGVAQQLFNIGRPFVFALHTLPLNRVRKKFGLPSLGANLNAVYTDGDLVAYADVPGLASMRPLPETHRFIGPILWSPKQVVPGWWDELDRESPVIYVNLGSSGRADLLPGIVESLRGLPVQFMIGKAGHSADIPQSDNAFVAEYLSGEAATARASLVICNGGSMSVYQSLKLGVPVLGIAGNLDQHLNMSAVERKGAGLKLRSDLKDFGILRDAACKLLEDKSFGSRSRDLWKEGMSRVDENCFSKMLQSI